MFSVFVDVVKGILGQFIFLLKVEGIIRILIFLCLFDPEILIQGTVEGLQLSGNFRVIRLQQSERPHFLGNPLNNDLDNREIFRIAKGFVSIIVKVFLKNRLSGVKIALAFHVWHPHFAVDGVSIRFKNIDQGLHAFSTDIFPGKENLLSKGCKFFRMKQNVLVSKRFYQDVLNPHGKLSFQESLLASILDPRFFLGTYLPDTIATYIEFSGNPGQGGPFAPHFPYLFISFVEIHGHPQKIRSLDSNLSFLDPDAVTLTAVFPDGSHPEMGQQGLISDGFSQGLVDLADILS